jgi:SAM-dependent methyltransferase
MQLNELLLIQSLPEPWGQHQPPWSEPVFSSRLLTEQLAREHTYERLIDEQVAFFDQNLLRRRPTSVLQLCCGPGLYTKRLSSLGYRCTGVDLSPAAVEYANAQLHVTTSQHIQGDVRHVEYGTGFGLILLLGGDLNSFSPRDAARILGKIYDALADDGTLVIELHTFSAIQTYGELPQTWRIRKQSRYGDLPHLQLNQYFWEPLASVAIRRVLVSDLRTYKTATYVQSYQAYTELEYAHLLQVAGFADVGLHIAQAALPTRVTQPHYFVVAHKYVSPRRGSASHANTLELPNTLHERTINTMCRVIGS